jgi:hypothetical protein
VIHLHLPAPSLLGSHQAAGGTSAVTDARAQRLTPVHAFAFDSRTASAGPLNVRLSTYRLRAVVKFVKAALMLTSDDI